MKSYKALLNKKFSIEDTGLYNKNAIAFFFVFVIPILLTCYLIFLAPRIIVDKDKLLTNARIIIILIGVCGLFGYLFLRKIIKTLMGIIKKAENLSLGYTNGKIEVAWNDELKDLAQSFNRINANLEVKIKELEYSQRLTRELFQQIGQAITSDHKVEALFNIIVHGARKVLDTASVFIALYDIEECLRLKACSGNQKNLRSDIELPCDKGIIGDVIKNRKPIVINNNDTKLRAQIGEDIISYEMNAVCVPILVKDRMKGVLCATDTTDKQGIDTEGMFLIESIASQISICVENLELNKDIEETYYRTLIMLARIIEAKDVSSAGHLERVTSYVQMMADKLNIEEEMKKILIGGALLHDLGKVGIEDVILKKQEQLSPQEYEMMKQHVIIGENILKPLRSMSKLSVLVRHHHEFYNGTGYPDGLKGEEIPLLARILAVADIYDALTSNRYYRKALSQEEAIEVLRSYAGKELDPKLVGIFIELIQAKK